MHAKSATTNARLVFLALFISVAFLLCATTVYAQENDASSGADAGDGTGATTDPNASPTLSNNGIFGCRGQGAQIANVGTTRAVGGVYVPVNDAAVTLNTGFLVYKECILDGMARKIAESGTAEIGKQTFKATQEGRNGGPQYLVNFGQEDRERGTAIAVTQIQNGTSQICEAFRQPIRTALARSYAQQFNNPNQIVACPVAGNDQGFFDTLFRSIEPCGNAANCYITERANIDSMVAYDRENYRRQLDWSGGVFPRYDSNDPLSQRVVTPGFIIANSITQVTGSGYRQLESANEIDQVVANLWGGLANRLVSGSGGIPGLFVSTGNQPAYIDRMVAETQAAVRAGAVNAAVAILSSARQAEAAYLTAKQGIATAFIGAITQLRAMEDQCWTLIIPKVQEMATAQNATLNIATSTQFSQAIIDSQIRASASTTAADITVSQQALTRIDQLIASVTNSASSAAQQQALVQLDQMVANNQLHSTQDAQTASTQRDSVTSAVSTLVNDTRTAWGDSTDPNIGWCNVNNTAVVERWFNAWRQ
jgi:hypothetical protein